jgi:xanthine dehydrogenase molybdopterin-binding subunit B
MTRLSQRFIQETSALSRRDFLVGVVGAVASFGFAPLAAAGDARATFEPTIWHGTDRDGIVKINIIRAEMAQHVGTALARILADELEADCAKARITAVDSDPK